MKEKDEIERILAELSALAGEHTEELANNFRLLTKLDFIFAKAGLAIDMNASRPLFNKDRYIHIRKGRHPLLDKKKSFPSTSISERSLTFSSSQVPTPAARRCR